MLKQRGLRHFLRVVLCLLVCWGCFLATGVGNAEKRVVKVAYFDMGSYYRYTSSEQISSYDVDYLRELAYITDLKFEFVYCGTWEQALKMLERHEVELVGTAQWTPEREQQYSYCLENYGYTVAELVQLPSSSIIYEDYAAIGRSVIGMTRGYVRQRELERLFERKHISPQLRFYNNQEELDLALEAGQIDLMAANSHVLKPEWTTVEKFSYAPFYFISWKGNEELTDRIDAAIITLNIQKPYFDDDTFGKYFPDMLKAPLSKLELDLIARQEVYTVYFDEEVNPISWYNKAADKMEGALVKACQEVRDSTGLLLRVRPKHEEKAEQRETTIRYTTLQNSASSDTLLRQPGTTEALMEEDFNLFMRVGEEYDLQYGNYSIGVIANRDSMPTLLLEKYPRCTLVSFKTPAECVRALADKKIDLAFLNIHVANNALIAESISSIKEAPVAPVRLGLGLQFEGKNNTLLAGIVNKGIQHINRADLNDTMVAASLQIVPRFNFWSFVREHPVSAALALALGIALLVGMAILATYYRVMRLENAKVLQADKDRSDFFARMSHDMRTPMNGIMGMVALSEQENNPTVLHDNLKKIQGSSEYLLGLINDSLDLQKIETGKLQLVPEIVETQVLIDSIMNMVKVTAENKQLQFELFPGENLDKYICCDTQRVRQIFINILSNAVKFTPAGGKVQVYVERLSKTDNIAHTKIRVVDTGVGMSKEFLQHGIFKVYTQEHNSMTGKYAGSGLGLAIAKSLVELMSGRLEVTSELGEGSCFTLYLDFEVVEPSEAQAALQHTHTESDTKQISLQGKKLLLCEDHPLNAEIAKRLLEKVGCSVVVAVDGQQGVESFKSSAVGEYAAVLMDIRMPVLDGLEATKCIRQLERADAPTVPIIAMSANAYAEDVKKSLAAGMNAHLAKPVEPQQLYSTLSKYIG